jgi:hypothetical protein
VFFAGLRVGLAGLVTNGLVLLSKAHARRAKAQRASLVAKAKME